MQESAASDPMIGQLLSRLNMLQQKACYLPTKHCVRIHKLLLLLCTSYTVYQHVCMCAHKTDNRPCKCHPAKLSSYHIILFITAACSCICYYYSKRNGAADLRRVLEMVSVMSAMTRQLVTFNCSGCHGGNVSSIELHVAIRDTS